MLTEYFLRDDLRCTHLAEAVDAAGLLRWAYRIAANAPAEDIYRNKEGRVTLRLTLDDRAYFLKLHRGIGWREIAKNLLQGRLPVIGAGSEYRALRALEAAGIASLTPAAYASLGRNPARLHSLILTDELSGSVSLEDFCAQWGHNPPDPDLRRRLVITLAEIAKEMHRAGINHRDFYLCHFHLYPQSIREQGLRCHLIDLHRAQLRRRTPRRWVIKDIAGLYFSAMDCGLTRRDRLRFIRHYCGGLRRGLHGDARFWRQVESRAQALYRKGNRESVSPNVP